MTTRKTTPKRSTSALNLLDHALSIEGSDPVEIAVGDIDITLRTSHTGAQVAHWQKIEREHLTDSATLMFDKSLAEEQKVERVSALMRTYTRALLTALTVDGTKDADINAAADVIVDLEGDARARVLRTVGVLAGVVDEDGNSFPSSPSSKTTSGTAK